MPRKRGYRTQDRAKLDEKESGTKPKKPPLTHFLCLPLVNESSRPDLEKSLVKFSQDDAGAGNVFHEKAVRPLGALHLTIGVMSLTDKEHVDGAIDMLQNLDLLDTLRHSQGSKPQGMTATATTGPMKFEGDSLSEQTEPSLVPLDDEAKSDDTIITSGRTSATGDRDAVLEGPNSAKEGEWTMEPLSSPPLSSLMRPVSPPPWPRPASQKIPVLSEDTSSPGSPLRLKISALHAMKSPSKTSVLFASVEDPTSRLLTFATSLRTSFTDAGFLVHDDRPLKLHATIVNTIYAKQGHPRARRRKAKKAAGAPEQTPANDKRDEHDETGSTKHEFEDELDEGGEQGEEDGKSEDGIHHKGETNDNSSQTTKQEEKPRFQQRFNATTLIEKYKDFVWAEDVHLDRLAICEMGAKTMYDHDGKVVEEKYTEVASIRLP
ncbi:hypothetical protein EV356DRAFT_530822 [Viridothelium virens]|uniref:A-kinase anchor protein 7-like phosphoesterase domain-containing protein n=1 Tax=Viridothelium virens TaxID=1048519 RepID=A0A6A6HGF4_VIRVR|nr:hypothetical protein EV356DRAFT_530822 [Viridothelium virens]